MAEPTLTCPRCFRLLAGGRWARFCSRCGLADVRRAAARQGSPRDLLVAGRVYRVLDRLAIGSLGNVYRCRFEDGTGEVEGVCKVARDACVNRLMENERAVLARLHAADHTGRYSPFLPSVVAWSDLADGLSDSARRLNILRTHGEIDSPDELYTLTEVRRFHPDGVDPRHVAWIWRRLLSVLGFVHSQGIVHGAVIPEHVLVEPGEHKLVLIDWCCAADRKSGDAGPVHTTGGYRDWYRRGGALRRPPTPATDVALAARCMLFLLGGDTARARTPAEGAITRHLERCIDRRATVRGPGAWRLLDDFDRLIDALWGPRTFVKLELPPGRRVTPIERR